MMADGGADAPLPPPANGGEFLLSLLHKSQHQQRHDPLTQQPPLVALQHQGQQQQPVALDPAVAAVGPTISAFTPPPWSSNGRDLPGTPTHFPRPHSLSPPNLPSNLSAFPQFSLNHFPANQFQGNKRLLGDNIYKLGFPENANHAIHSLVEQQQKPPLEQPKLLFGSFSNDAIQGPNGLLDGNSPYDSKLCSAKEPEYDLRNLQYVKPNSRSGSNSSQQFKFGFHEHRGGDNHSGGHNGNNSRSFKSTPPPGFSSKQRGWNQDFRSSNSNNRNNRSGGLHEYVDWPKGGNGELSNRSVHLNGGDEILGRESVQGGNRFELGRQLDHPGPSAGSNLHSLSASDTEDSLSVLHIEVRGEGGSVGKYGQSRMKSDVGLDCEKGVEEIDDFGEELVDSLLLEDEADDKDGKDEKKKRRNSRDKESRIDDRGQWLLSQRLRILKRQMACRSDIHRLNAPFLAVYAFLIPAEEELAKQKQLLALLEKLVSKEWPEARLYLYGSCANSFGFPKSDIDVCLAIEDADINKSEMLLKLADILQSDNLQNVQALTRARVPIVKLMDPVTGISCDICINNVLAVVNTKLLRDYARIDVRLRQLAFIVKHWAKSRGVNETYHGTLSSYAYVLMCIHFLQQRRPSILPCLQEMEPTYLVNVDHIQCSFFDEVDKLCDFGARNRETIAQLVWGFFNYWAYGHDYANSVASVRTGSILSKSEKEWTRRIGNDRHLICIEDPFETSHDLGRVVDKFSIRVLRGEFERAAEIMQHDPNPCVTLFQPYVPSHN